MRVKMAMLESNGKFEQGICQVTSNRNLDIVGRKYNSGCTRIVKENNLKTIHNRIGA